MSKQVTYEPFGDLIWDDNLDAWTGKIEIAGSHSVGISILPEGRDIEETTKDAQRGISIIKSSEEGYRLSASNELLELHNNNWNEGPEIDQATFVNKMKLEAINFYEGGAELFYNDGGLFSGHSIVVTVDENGAFQDTSIFG